ncbi:ABC transporter [Nemania abortiva]|nr:ABC transporter [Nemania abortiva]
MTSIPLEPTATIACTCKQTRFDIGKPNYRELGIEGLNITVFSGVNSPFKAKKSKSHGVEILHNAKLQLKAGQRYALLGRNGTGKSTLLKAIAKKLIPGIPEETRVVLLQQTEPKESGFGESSASSVALTSNSSSVIEAVIGHATARDIIQEEIKVLSRGIESNNVYGPLRALREVRYGRLQRELFLKDKDARLRSGARGMAARKALIATEKELEAFKALYSEDDHDIPPDILVKETSEAANMLAELELQIEPSRLANVESRAKSILRGLGFPDGQMQAQISSLSGGWKMRTALAASLLEETDILLLDEPTNFLDMLGIIWLQHHLTSLAESMAPPTLVLVSHDRNFISLCTDLLIIKDKDLEYFHGDLPMYESSKVEKKLYLTKMKEAKDKQREHIQQTIQINMREGKAKDDQNKIRQAKSRQKKLDDRFGLEVSAKGGRFRLNRDLGGFHFKHRLDIEVPPEERGISFIFPPPPDLRFPAPLLSLENMSFRYTPTGMVNALCPLVLKDITLSIGIGDRVGILGLNGCGKSTLVRLLVGETTTPTGAFSTHPRLKLGYYSQHAVERLQRMVAEESDLTALNLLIREVSGDLDEGEVRGLLGSLGLPGRVASDTPVCRLSGGQLVRLELARLLWKRPHCLILDEVTTHLDYETVVALREALTKWEGAVIVVSHDRWFLRGVVEGEAKDERSKLLEGEDEVPRRRALFHLKAGQLCKLDGGMQEFEVMMDRRASQLMGKT